jgi:aromatic ring-opening dioxygenase catalytic subunit (LigB family)
VTDYGDENPLLMDYYGFTPQFYELKFSSHGDGTLSRRVVELFGQVSSLSLYIYSDQTDLCSNHRTCP